MQEVGQPEEQAEAYSGSVHVCLPRVFQSS